MAKMSPEAAVRLHTVMCGGRGRGLRMRKVYWVVLPWVWMVPDVSFYYEASGSGFITESRTKVEVSSSRKIYFIKE